MISKLWGTLRSISVGNGGGSGNEGDHGNSGIPGAPGGRNSPLPDADEILEKVQFKGTLTAFDIETGKAVIDRKYKVPDMYKFIPKGSSSDSASLERGTRVQFEAVRSKKDAQWTVVSLNVQLRDEAEENMIKMRKNERDAHFKAMTAQVVRVCDEWTEVEVGHSKKLLKVPNNPELKFFWSPGDWMELQMESTGDEGTTGRILSIAPLQRKTVIGKVTARQPNYFLVDDSIYLGQGDTFKSKEFGGGVGAIVKCEAIFSDQSLGRSGIVKWRAIHVGKSNSLQCSSSLGGDWQVDEVGRATLNHHEELMRDKCEIRINPKHINFSVHPIGTSSSKTFTIRNDSSQVPVSLKSYRFTQEDIPFEISCCSVPSLDEGIGGSVFIMPGDELVFEVQCTPLLIGRTEEICVFDFGICEIGRNFTVIGRAPEEKNLEVEKGSSERRKYIGREEGLSRILEDKERKRIRGSQVVRAPFFSQKRLPVNRVPRELYQIMRDQDERKLQRRYPRALEPLCFENYKDKFQLGLWFEEIENDIRRRQYDLYGVKLEQCGTDPVVFQFHAPMIQDMMPSVSIQDTVDVFDPESETKVRFQGTIVNITENNMVMCIFSQVFNERYSAAVVPLTVMFNLGRTNYKRSHFAVDTAFEYLGKEILFPEAEIDVKPSRIQILNGEQNFEEKEDQEKDEVAGVSEDQEGACMPDSGSLFRRRKHPSKSEADGKSETFTLMTAPLPSSSKSKDVLGRRAPSNRSTFVSDTPSTPSCSSARLRWFNQALNEEQRNAVRRILQGNARPIPYIIYGPPGTGKTVTLVEAVMQVNTLDKNSRILVCAPSNSAADVIAEHLAKSGQYSPGDWVRLNGFMRAGQPLPESIEPFCADGEDLQKVAMHRFIVSTCTTAGQFFNLKLTVGHFTHVFVDEAGYCTEPDTMVPATLLALSKGGQLILAGDPRQLGPVLMSDIAQNIGLNQSFLERLMSLELYSRDEEKFPREKYNPLVVTKLVKNYRAHPSLLTLPSALFYHGDLEARASFEDAHQLCHDPQMKDVLVSEGVPLVIHGVQGISKQEDGSTSWCNRAEAVTVVRYVEALSGRCGITMEDIGIITPYRKQVEKIRAALEMSPKLGDCLSLPKVASVEEFQGGERKIIIISTVRSSYADKAENRWERFGFLYEPKRFNVAVTRAKALLIVIGHPFVLAGSEFWLQLLRYAVELNAYKGCNLPVHLDPKMRKLVRDSSEGKGQLGTLGNEEEETEADVEELEKSLKLLEL